MRDSRFVACLIACIIVLTPDAPAGAFKDREGNWVVPVDDLDAAAQLGRRLPEAVRLHVT